MRGADAVDVRGAIRDDEIRGIDHAEIAVQGRPIMAGHLGALVRSFLGIFERPALAHLLRVNILLSVLVQSAHLRLVPGIENDGAEIAQHLTDARAPPVLLLILAVPDEVHRTGQIHARAAKQRSRARAAFAFFPRHLAPPVQKSARSCFTSADLLHDWILRANM